MVDEVFSNAIDVLNDEDKKLPQVEHVLPLLKRGIGIHHGGKVILHGQFFNFSSLNFSIKISFHIFVFS